MVAHESRETREARNVLASRKSDYRWHVTGCAECSRSRGPRQPPRRCATGEALRQAVTDAEHEVKENVRLDALPDPAQQALPGLESET